VRIEFDSEELQREDLKAGYSHGEVDVYQYSRNEYQLGVDFIPIRDNPPEHQRLKFSDSTTFNLPAYSLTIVRG
jgi:hypothetical protein